MAQLPPEMMGQILYHVLRPSPTTAELALRHLDEEPFLHIERHRSALRVCRMWYALGVPHLMNTLYFDGSESCAVRDEIQDMSDDSRCRNREEKGNALTELLNFLQGRGSWLAYHIKRVVVRVATLEQAETLSEILRVCGQTIEELSWSFTWNEGTESTHYYFAKRAAFCEGLYTVTPRAIWITNGQSFSAFDGHEIMRKWSASGLRTATIVLENIVQKDHWLLELRAAQIELRDVAPDDMEWIQRMARSRDSRHIVLAPAYDWVAEELESMVEQSGDTVRTTVTVVKPSTRT